MRRLKAEAMYWVVTDDGPHWSVILEDGSELVYDAEPSFLWRQAPEDPEPQPSEEHTADPNCPCLNCGTAFADQQSASRSARPAVSETNTTKHGTLPQFEGPRPPTIPEQEEIFSELEKLKKSEAKQFKRFSWSDIFSLR